MTAYIIDTGIRFSHSEFGGRAVSGFDAVDGGSADDCHGHGTHVAGTVGGSTYGVAKGVTLVAVRVLNCSGSGSTSGVIAGIDWVTGNHAAGAPAVANMSLGGGASTALDTAVQTRSPTVSATRSPPATATRAAVRRTRASTRPRGSPKAMTIGATDQTDTKTSWSNYGNCVDWFAPGALDHVGLVHEQHRHEHDQRHLDGHAAHRRCRGAVPAGESGRLAAAVRTALYDDTTKGVVKSSKTANNHLLFTNY